MPGDLRIRLNSLTTKAQMLLERYERLREAKAVADSRIEELSGIVARQEREIAQLKAQIEHLVVMSAIAPSRDDAAKARLLLTELVQEIDKCINDLTE